MFLTSQCFSKLSRPESRNGCFRLSKDFMDSGQILTEGRSIWWPLTPWTGGCVKPELRWWEPWAVSHMATQGLWAGMDKVLALLPSVLYLLGDLPVILSVSFSIKGKRKYSQNCGSLWETIWVSFCAFVLPGIKASLKAVTCYMIRCNLITLELI